MRVLVVEDDQDLRDTIVDMLTHTGHEALSAFDRADALTKLSKEHVDIVLVSEKLSEYEHTASFLGMIQTILPTAGIILAPGHLVPSRTAKLADFVLPKPFSFEEMDAAITFACSMRRLYKR